MPIDIPDLPPITDPRGCGSTTKTPWPPLEGEPGYSWTPPKNGNGSATVWRTIALCLLAADITGAIGFLTLGIDNVKHSEIDQIMATRAPYIHAAPLIEARFKTLEKTDADTTNYVRDMREEFRGGDARIIQRIDELEKNYYMEHPNAKK